MYMFANLCIIKLWFQKLRGHEEVSHKKVNKANKNVIKVSAISVTDWYLHQYNVYINLFIKLYLSI